MKILNVWTPEIIENGTQSSAIVDCEYSLDDRDISTLEIKWYFRFDPTPIYTWVPPNPPQVCLEIILSEILGFETIFFNHGLVRLLRLYF